MLYLVGITIAFFLGLLLVTKKNKTLADKILAAWLFIIGVHLCFFYLGVSGRKYDYPFLLGLHFPLPLLHGPFLYLYALALTGNLNSKTKTAIHFLPALISYLFLIPYIFSPPEEKIYIFQNKGLGYEGYLAINSLAVLISGVVYVLLTALLHRRHRRKILQEFSYTEKINLDWILYLIIGIALIWVFVILNKDDLVFGTAVLLVLFIGYFGFNQVGIFAPGPESPEISSSPSEESDPVTTNTSIKTQRIETKTSETEENVSPIIEASFLKQVPDRKKYSKSGLSPDSAKALHQKLQNLMNSEKIFTESELTLTELAKKLGAHPNYLSQVINENEGKNFYDYINELRTKEFQRLILDPRNQKFTLLSVAYECGFNSKSSFNKYFKKVTGLSPSDYLKQIQTVKAA